MKLKHKNGHPLKKQNIWKFIIEIVIQTMLSVTGSVGRAGQAVTISLYFNEYVLFRSVTGCVEGLYPEGQAGAGPGVRQV